MERKSHTLKSVHTGDESFRIAEHLDLIWCLYQDNSKPSAEGPRVVMTHHEHFSISLKLFVEFPIGTIPSVVTPRSHVETTRTRRREVPDFPMAQRVRKRENLLPFR